MIEKKIHYCWFGKGEMKPLMKKCLKSWKKYCPDYEIIEWNEDNFDVNSTLWTKQAYEAKKYAFVSDYVRLKVLYEHGGVYMDTDVEVVKPIDEFLVHDVFCGFESDQTINTGIIGAVKENSTVKRWLQHYDDLPYIVDGKPCMEPNVIFIKDDLEQHGLVLDDSKQNIDGVEVYPRTYFCPLSAVSIEQKITENTYTLHHFTSTWRTEKALKDFARVKRHQTKWYRTLEKLRYLPNKTVRKIFGDERIDSFKNKLKK